MKQTMVEIAGFGVKKTRLLNFFMIMVQELGRKKDPPVFFHDSFYYRS